MLKSWPQIQRYQLLCIQTIVKEPYELSEEASVQDARIRGPKSSKCKFVSKIFKQRILSGKKPRVSTHPILAPGLLRKFSEDATAKVQLGPGIAHAGGEHGAICAVVLQVCRMEEFMKASSLTAKGRTGSMLWGWSCCRKSVLRPCLVEVW